ncbi:hypothetical protein Bca4012_033158 [Brassica carinata]
MGKEGTVLILCFYIISCSAIYVSAQTCDDTAGNFKPGSPYDKNRRLINSTLASNITSHNGWVNGSIGLGPNIVYNMGMCSPENPVDRPTLSTIYQMLTNSSVTLPVPRTPRFFFGNGPRSNPSAHGLEPGQSSSKSIPCSVDEATITDVTPR